MKMEMGKESKNAFRRRVKVLLMDITGLSDCAENLCPHARWEISICIVKIDDELYARTYIYAY